MNTMTLIIIGAIIVIMAIIGYIADKKGMAKKPVKEERPQVKPQEPQIETWSEDAKPKDERQETIHKVPTMDDWASLPENENQLPEVDLENPNLKEETIETSEPMFSELNQETSEVPEIKEPVLVDVSVPILEENEPKIEEESASVETPTLEPVETLEPIVDNSVNEGPNMIEPETMVFTPEFADQVQKPISEPDVVETLTEEPEQPITESMVEQQPVAETMENVVNEPETIESKEIETKEETSIWN